MSDDLDPIRLMDERAWIRVYNFQNAPIVEGRVVAYCDQPTIIVEGDDGRQMHCPVGMRRERLPEPERPAPASEPGDGGKSTGYVQPAVTFDFAVGNARRLLQAAEQETDRQLMERYEKLGDSWISLAGLLLAHRQDVTE